MDHQGVWIGIDVSEGWIDVAVGSRGKPYRRVYREEEIRREAEQWARLDLAGIVCESSGIYHERLVRMIQDVGLPIAVVNPHKVVAHRTASTGIAKSDPLDARLLASFGEWRQPAPLPWRSPDEWDLRELVATRASTVRQLGMCRSQRKQRVEPLVQDVLEARIRFLGEQIAQLDQAISRVIARNPAMARTRRILMSMPGVGPVISAVLIAFMPELGTLDRRRLASLAGLAPHPRDSGTSSGYRMVRGGRKRIATVLYLAATRFGADPVLMARKAHLQSLGTGKKAKVVNVAMARWMATVLDTMVRDGILWTELEMNQGTGTTD